MIEPMERKLVLYSHLAFYPIHWQAFLHLCAHYRVRGTAIAVAQADLPLVHQQLGWVDPRTIGQDAYAPAVRILPARNRLARVYQLCKELRRISPDAIWAQEEPTDPYLLQILGMYLFNRRPRIVSAVCENTFAPGSPAIRLSRRILWSRLDGLLAVATPSLEGIRAAGMPEGIPAASLVAGATAPPDQVDPLPLPFGRTARDFVLGFVGRICEEKGWKVLLTAMLSLPGSVYCLLAGDGPQIGELQEWMKRPKLRERVSYMGLLPKDMLWRFYAALDCLVLPSLTLPGWKEQFGGVLADGMAMGLPLIGSDSGAIPEVIGPAGLTVPEGEAEALGAAIERLQQSPDLCQNLGEAGRRRFREEWAIPAYATKIARMLGLILR